MNETFTSLMRPDPHLDRMARLTAVALHVPVAVIAVYDDSRVAFPGLSGLPSASAYSRVIDRPPPAGEWPPSSRTSQADEITTSRHWLSALTEIRSYLCTPIPGTGTEISGVLYAVDHDPRAWTSLDVQNLEDLAAAIGRGLPRHRIGADRTRTASATMPPRSVHTTPVLRQAETPEELRRVVWHLASEQLGASYVSLLAVPASSGALPAAAPAPMALPGVRTSPEPDTRVLTHWGEQALAAAADAGMGSGAFAPVIVDGALKGVLAVGWRTPDEPGEPMRRGLDSLAAEVSRAIGLGRTRERLLAQSAA
ncbi:GAF domain-containing protein [Streptomyces sp. NPDC047023]|uniref:GAF domain-containing protein n=1 Tax=Streptomyces sp. NPDC047023 TaxID=3155139 RepID=UPI0033F1A8C5